MGSVALMAKEGPASVASWGCLGVALATLGAFALYLLKVWDGHDRVTETLHMLTLVTGAGIVLLLVLRWRSGAGVKLPKLHPLLALAIFAGAVYLNLS
jgi:hypothetical protein